MNFEGENAVASPAPTVIVDTCPECGSSLPEGSDLAKHFNSGDASNLWNCYKCRVDLPSECSLKAHIRIHFQQEENRKPHICPECGVSCAKWETFLDHLHDTCMHAYINECYKCKCCSAIFPTSISLEVHLLRKHVVKIYKCSCCPIACLSFSNLIDHRLKAHGKREGKSVTYHQCQLCPGRLITQSMLLFHMHQHAMETSNLIIRYMCEPCNIFEEKKDQFVSHKAKCKVRVSKFTKIDDSIVKDMPVAHKQYPSHLQLKLQAENFQKINGEGSNLEERNGNRDRRESCEKNVNGECSKSGSENNLSENKESIEKEENDINKEILHCKKQLSSKPVVVLKRSSVELIESYKKNKGEPVLKVRSRPCHKCGTTMQYLKQKKTMVCFNCRKDLRKLEAKKIEQTKKKSTQKVQIYKCQHCGDTMPSKWATIEAHFFKEHKNIKLVSMHQLIKKENELDDQIVTNKEEEIINSDEGVESNGKLVCNVCCYNTDNVDEFKEHLVGHRPTDTPSLQCMECGICYVVKPSLEKHLVLKHQIRGVDQYLDNTGQPYEKDLAVVEKAVALKENQCKVCFAEFQSSQELNAHFRTHGMAFLLDKRGIDMLRSP